MNPFRFLLYPFAVLYSLVTDVRNKLYDSGRWRSASFSIPVINVGNLNTGGSGKTPHIEYLISLLRPHYKVATLSRGYGRRSKGFIIAEPDADARVIGDEPAQIKHKFPDITVSVGESRLLAIPQILKAFPHTEVILLDDAYQHRSVRPGLNILLTDYQLPFYKDKILPVGHLRENIEGRKRADIIIVTKCPDHLSEEEKQVIISGIKPYLHQRIFFSSIIYGPLKDAGSASPLSRDVQNDFTVLTGIARPDSLYTHLDHQGIRYQKIRFRDHHRYTRSDVEDIITKARAFDESRPAIITTEKDYTRLRPFTHLFQDHGVNILLAPIEMKIMTDEKGFENIVMNYIKSVQADTQAPSF